MKKRRIAVIGLGGIARKAYLPILAVDQSIEIDLFNRSQESLIEIQSQYRIPSGSTKLEEIIARQPQAAFVLTSSPSHYEIARCLLQAGIDVFLEKPATMYSAQTRELAELAQQHNRILMVGFNRRFAPLHIKARELWGKSVAGMGVFTKFRHDASYENIWQQYIEDTIHQVDLLRFYCGEGHAVSLEQHLSAGKVLSTACTIALENGGIAVILTNFQAGRWQEQYMLYGTQQTMEIEAFSQLRFIQQDVRQQWDESYSSSWTTTLKGRGFVNQIDHFFYCIETRQQPLTSGWDSLKTQILLEEIMEQAGDNKV